MINIIYFELTDIKSEKSQEAVLTAETAAVKEVEPEENDLFKWSLGTHSFR